MANNNEAKIKFTAETGEFNNQIKTANSTMSELRSELKLNSAQMKNTGESAELLTERHEILQKELNAAKEKTEALSKKLEAAEKIFGENSEEAKKLQTQLNNAKSAEEKIQSEIDDTNKKLKDQKSAFDEVGEKAEKLGDKLTTFGKGMSVVSAGIAAIGTASIAAFNEVDEGADNVIKATGATGDLAAELEASYKNVASSIVGDFGDIGTALGEVNTRFGFTGGALETASTKFLKFSEVTGMDATSAVQAVSRAIESAGLKSSDYSSILDSLVAVGQATGVSVDTLAQSLTDNGAAMREMGYNTTDSIAMLAQFEKAGVDASSVTRGMRTAIAKWGKEGKNAKTEFKKMVEGIENGTVSAGEAYEVFGSKAGVELVDAIQSGRFSYEEMLKVVEGSKGALETTFDGTVDGGYEMELAMQNAKTALAEVGNTLATTLTPLVKTATEKLQGFAKWWGGLDEKAQKTIITIAGVVAAIGPVLVVLGTLASSITKITTLLSVIKGAMAAATVAQTGLNLAFLACPITWIILAIVALVAIFVVLWNKCEGFRNFWINLWENIKNAFAVVVNWIKDNWQSLLLFIMNPVAGVFKYLYDNFEGFRKVVDNVLNAVKNFFVNAWESIKNVWSNVTGFFRNVGNGIKNVFSGIGGWFRNKFNEAKTNAVNAWSDAKSKFSTVREGVKSVFSTVGGWFRNKFTEAKNGAVNSWSDAKSKFSTVWSGIKSVFSKVVSWATEKFTAMKNKITSIWSKLKLNLPKIKLPHFSIQGKFSLSPPSVPKLKVDWYANGGIMTRPTIFGMNGNRLMAGGEAGPEAIRPIDRLQGYVSGAVEKSMQALNLQVLADAVEDLANRPVQFNVNGRQFALATASDTESVSGLRSTFKSRGLALD